jgi:hypothetical protein
VQLLLLRGKALVLLALHWHVSPLCAAAGQIDADELVAVVEKIAEKQSTIRHLRFIIAALVGLS